MSFLEQMAHIYALNKSVKFIFYSADKLLSNVNVDITFYIDKKIDNEFIIHARDDLQCVSDRKIKTTDKQVGNIV